MRRRLLAGVVCAIAGVAAIAAAITDAKLRTAQTDPGAWLMYGKNYAAWRYSELSQINTANVAKLAPRWMFQTAAAALETTPLVFDGLMFATGAENRAFALDLLTGRPVWRYAKPIPKGVMGCCGSVNRGFAALGDRLFKVNYEGTLVALDAKTGSALWETKLADFHKGYSATAAPLIVKNQVIVGIAGAEFGTRGFVDAYDVTTGERLWRFYTVAGPDDPGGKTWNGDAYMRGGGSTWVTGSYDPDLNLIYWGTGNPGPDMNGDIRPGDNIYTCSMLALDADTGKLKWHYQFTPHDVHDWDSTEDPVLVDLKLNGSTVKALLHANRTGLFYALDRTNGKVLVAKPYTKVTWTTGIGSDGRPILVPGQEPSEKGTESCPGLGGGHNWQPTAYSPQTGLYYFGSTDGCHIFYKNEQEYVAGQWYQLSTVDDVPHHPNDGSVVAIDPMTGETKWRLPLIASPGGGMLATAGGLVFTGDDEGYLIGIDARTGKPLWKFQTGGRIAAAPVTYSFRGKQYLAVAASDAILAFALPD
jgi:alcohol dehydrogenase (cytochrome c)